ncbi:unnamed protein product [Blepharisma stoltei]|uniref:Uncharacterized protein n=1 Tax=Blepharisma stoltei TaxID=1481888 RepID=A0AAU9IAN1_9CILI|nr:unnamed protein product [Blepharisma stoltei]
MIISGLFLLLTIANFFILKTYFEKVKIRQSSYQLLIMFLTNYFSLLYFATIDEWLTSSFKACGIEELIPSILISITSWFTSANPSFSSQRFSHPYYILFIAYNFCSPLVAYATKKLGNPNLAILLWFLLCVISLLADLSCIIDSLLIYNFLFLLIFALLKYIVASLAIKFFHIYNFTIMYQWHGFGKNFDAKSKTSKNAEINFLKLIEILIVLLSFFIATSWTLETVETMWPNIWIFREGYYFLVSRSIARLLKDFDGKIWDRRECWLSFCNQIGVYTYLKILCLIYTLKIN